MPKGTLPWEYGGDLGKAQTGSYAAVSGPVAQFGEVPKAAKAVTHESLEPEGSDLGRPAVSSATLSKAVKEPAVKELQKEKVPDRIKKEELPPEQVPDGGKDEYDFLVHDVKVDPPLYRPAGTAQVEHDITALNRSAAPVSVLVDVDEAMSENISANKAMPVHAVVPPNSETVLFHYGPKREMEFTRLRYRYCWSIGDYQATHSCPEHYRFPFPDHVRAFASLPNGSGAKPVTLYDYFFEVPAGTPIRAARKGTVIRIKDAGKIDILHEDATVATYSHVGKIAEGIVVNRIVSAGEVIGAVRALGNDGSAYLQFAVWRPQLVQHPTPSAKADTFKMVSFPLEFCRADGTHCTVLTHDQPILPYKAASGKKPNKRKDGREGHGSSSSALPNSSSR